MIEQKTKNLIACALAHGYSHGVNSLHYIAIPLLVSFFTLSYSAAGAMSSVFYITFALISYPAGRYSTRFGRKNLIVFYLLSGAVIVFLTGLSPTYAFVLLCSILTGAILGIYHPSGTVLVINSYEEKGRGKALGYHEVGGVGGTLVMVLLGGMAAKWLGWRYIFFISAVPGILIGLLCVAWAKDVEVDKKGAQQDEHAMNLPAVVAIILCSGLQMLSVAGFRTWCPALLIDRFGIGIMSASLLSSIVPAVSMVTSPIFGHISDRYGREIVLGVVLLCFVLSLLGIAFASTLLLMGIALVFAGAVYIAIVPIGNAYLSEAITSSTRGSIFGIHVGFMFLTSTAAPVVVGSMADAFGFTSGMVLLAGVSFLGLLIMIFVPRMKRRPKPVGFYTIGQGRVK